MKSDSTLKTIALLILGFFGLKWLSSMGSATTTTDGPTDPEDTDPDPVEPQDPYPEPRWSEKHLDTSVKSGNGVPLAGWEFTIQYDMAYYAYARQSDRFSSLVSDVTVKSGTLDNTGRMPSIGVGCYCGIAFTEYLISIGAVTRDQCKLVMMVRQPPILLNPFTGEWSDPPWYTVKFDGTVDLSHWFVNESLQVYTFPLVAQGLQLDIPKVTLTGNPRAEENGFLARFSNMGPATNGIISVAATSSQPAHQANLPPGTRIEFVLLSGREEPFYRSVTNADEFIFPMDTNKGGEGIELIEGIYANHFNLIPNDVPLRVPIVRDADYAAAGWGPELPPKYLMVLHVLNKYKPELGEEWLPLLTPDLKDFAYMRGTYNSTNLSGGNNVVLNYGCISIADETRIWETYGLEGTEWS